MDNKKPKRGRPKLVGGQPSRKKSRDMDASDQEMREKIEAANVLSSLRFLPPQSQEGSGVTSKEHAVDKAVKIPVTCKMSDQNHGNSTSLVAAPSIGSAVRNLSPSKGSVRGHEGVVLNEQANKLILKHLYNSLQNRQGKNDTPSSAALVKNLPSASIIPKSGDAKKCPVIAPKQTSPLPNVLNPSNPVNKVVAAALKNAISAGMARMQTSPKQLEGGKSKKPVTARLLGQHISDDKDSEAQESDKKTDNTDNTLPLKKRRILPHEEKTVSSLSTSQVSEADVKNLIRLARSTQMTSMISEAPIKPYAVDGYKPIDPSASLRVLSDVKQALTPDEDGDLPLHIAVVHKHNVLAKKFVDIMTMSGKNVDRYNKLMQTPLHLAVLVEEPGIILTMLSSSANPNLMDRNGCTAMHLAVEKGFLECLETLLEYSVYECDLNTRNYEGYMPLHTAVERNDFEAMVCLLKHGLNNNLFIANNNYTLQIQYMQHNSGFDGYTPLHTAVERNDFEAMVCLLKHGANIDVQDGKAGRSVIYYAVEYGRYKMCRYLHNQGANLDLPNYAGITPAMAAQSNNQQKILDLIGKGLEGSKPVDESILTHSSRKLPLPRIPSKASLIVPEEKTQGFSRSNSMEEVKPYKVRRSSFSAPVDLSFKAEKASELVKAENATVKDLSVRSKPTVNTTEKNKPAKLVEKHAVLVEQLQRQSKETSDQGPYIYLSKQKYEALLALSFQKYRTNQLGGYRGKTRTLSLDDSESKETMLNAKPIKSDLFGPLTKAPVKSKIGKSKLNEDEHEFLEKIKSAKIKEGKEGEALLSEILTSDLKKNLTKLGENCEVTQSVGKQLPSMSTNLSQAVKNVFRGELISESVNLHSVNGSLSKMEVEKSDCVETGSKDVEKAVLSHQSLVSDQVKITSVSESEAWVKTDDSDELRHSQGFDTQEFERTDVSKEGSVKSKSEEVILDHESGQDSDNEKLEEMDFEITENDSSSVEVQEALPMDEDDEEDGPLVIDEKVDGDRQLNSQSALNEVNVNEELAKTDKNSLHNKLVKDDEINATKSQVEQHFNCEEISRKERTDSDSQIDQSLSPSAESTISADSEKFEFDKTQCSKTGMESLTYSKTIVCHDNKKFEQVEKTAPVLLRKKDDLYNKTVRERQIQDKAKFENKVDEEIMCKVQEKTEWETASLATHTPPPLSEFEHIVKSKDKVASPESLQICVPLPPVLTPVARLDQDTGRTFSELDGHISDGASMKNYYINEKPDSKTDKSISSTNTDSKHDEANKILGSESSQTDSKCKVKTKPEYNKYINEAGFQFYLKEKGVKIDESLNIEQYYRKYKSVEEAILKDIGIIPMAEQNKQSLHLKQEQKREAEEKGALHTKGEPLKVTVIQETEKCEHDSSQAQTISTPSTSATKPSSERNELLDKESLKTDSSSVNLSDAHTLYFFDGLNYRSVKVYLDDSKASSEQFKKLFLEKVSQELVNSSVMQSSQSGPAGLSSAVIQSVPGTSHEKLKDVNKVCYRRAKDDNSVSYGGSKDKTIASLTKTMKSASFDSGKVSQSVQDFNFKDILKTHPIASGSGNTVLSQFSQAKKDNVNFNANVKDKSSLLRKSLESPKRLSIVYADSTDMNLASVVDKSVPHRAHSESQNEIQHLAKKTLKVPADSVSSQICGVNSAHSKGLYVPRTLSMSTGKPSIMTSEGTLTRVNPDIKNKLSKALQSPSRKLNITKTDSSERLLPVPSSNVNETSIAKEGNLRFQI